MPRWLTVDWWFRDRESGRIVIAQFPNLPMWFFLGCVGLSIVVPDSGGLATALTIVSTGALLWWAADELLRGVNPWRRALGVAGLAFAVLRLVG